MSELVVESQYGLYGGADSQVGRYARRQLKCRSKFSSLAIFVEKQYPDMELTSEFRQSLAELVYQYARIE